MPLADLSNAQQRPTRGKRFSLSNDVVPKGENVAPPSHLPSPKETPPRFLAPTKASAAKTNRAQPHSGRNTPVLQAQHSSKLARSGGAATITPPTSKWSASTADSVGLFDKSLQSSKSSPLLRVVTESEDCQSSSPSQSMPFIGRRTPATEKPLPARPVASLAYGPSPSKDSRTLIDAVERPLRLSIAGSQQDWPTLSPSPRFTPVLYQPTSSFDIDETQLTTPSARFPSTAATLLAAASELNRKMTGQNNDHHKESSNAVAGRSSSFPSSANVSDDAPFDKTESTTCDATHEDAHVSSPDHDTPSSYPTRTSSLRDRLSSGSLLECGPDSGNKVTGFTDFTRDVDLTSRPHSPSPASFSRPRPTSISHPSFVPTPTVVAASPVRTPRTASRIPMSDPKKATLVNIKSRRSSAIPLPQGDKGLSFGGRRINSPDPLKVLDHGIKRQQLKRANTNSSTSTSSTVPSKLLHNNVTPSIHRSKTSSPDGTMGSSTDDEEEVTTPSDKSLHFVKHGFKPKHVNRVSTGHCGGAILKVYDEAEVVLGRPPPSNSPFTGPLQTIPSQTALPVDGASPTCASFGDELQPRVVIKPTEFSAFAERLSLLQDSHKLASDDSIQGADLNDDTRSELVDLLREAEHEDALISQCGAMGLDVETREEIFRTLSVLEGRSGPPNTSVDIEQLPFMFGRLRSGFEKAPKSAAFVEDATLAERFLARQNSTASEAAQRIIQAKANGHVFAPATGGQESDAASQDSRSKTILSKWSDSTTSAKNSPGLKNDNAARQSFVTGWDGVSPGVLPKGEVSSRGSIGFPSRIPGVSAKAHRLLGGDERSISSQKTNVRRISSPTLGSTVPGSVKAAHKRVLNAAGSMSSRATMSSRSKNDQMPTPNTKPYSFSNELPRGRFSSAEVSSSKATRAVKTPRSRSKSRYVLDKLNGFFSNKRDRRNSEILPPVPSIKERPELDRQPTKKRDHATSLGSPVAKPSRLPPLTKMPTVSPPVNAAHPALSSTSLDTPTTTGSADYEGRRSLQTLSDKLIGRAQREGDPARKERLLNFAKVLNDSLISAREAQISAETAQTAARSAQLSYEMTMKSVAMLQRLASSMNRR